MHHWNHIHNTIWYNLTEQCSCLCAAYTLHGMQSTFFCCFIPLTCKILWNGFFLTGMAMSGRVLLSTVCAPNLHIIIQILVCSELRFYRLFFVVLIFAQILQVSMGLILPNTLYCGSQISLQNSQQVWSHVLLAFSKDYFPMAWLSDGWKWTPWKQICKACSYAKFCLFSLTDTAKDK